MMSTNIFWFITHRMFDSTSKYTYLANDVNSEYIQLSLLLYPHMKICQPLVELTGTDGPVYLDGFRSLAQMRLIIEETADEVTDFAARYVRNRINAHNCGPDRPFVLGLPTGSTPLGMYKKLIKFLRGRNTVLQICNNIQYG
ncbi:hypothetical protein COOONC_09044 [Cooperia oncophora]